jgi:hypothetical protein
VPVNISRSGVTRRTWMNPRIVSTSMMAAATKTAIAAQRAIWPICQNAYALSSRPRSVSPLKSVSA